MNAPKNISTLIHITLGIGILLVVISAIMPIINTSKSDGFKKYANNISQSYKNFKTSTSNNMKSSGKEFIDFIKSLWNNKWNKINCMVLVLDWVYY